MDRVGEEGHGARDQDDSQLEHGRDAEPDEGDLDRLDPADVAGQGLIERVARVVAVADDRGDEPADPTMAVAVPGVIVLTAVVAGVIRMLVRARMPVSVLL